MKLPLPSGFSTPDGIAAWARRLVGSIAASWAVDHNADGTHKFPWTDAPYDATRFTGSGSMTWGVAVEDHKIVSHRVAGDSCLFAWRVVASDCGGGSNILRIRLPDGVRPSRVVSGAHYYSDAGTEGMGLARVSPELTHINLFKTNTSSNWTATTADDTYSEGSLEFPITQ